MAKNKISLKLLVDTTSNVVVFAEADKDFVDFLFGLLNLPLGSILSLFLNHSMSVGSVCKIYESVRDLSSDYIQPKQNINSLLNPQIAGSSKTKQTPLLMEFGSWDTSSYGSRVEGYVKAAVIYMVTDDLMVKPVSTISSITAIKNLGVKDLDSVGEEKVEIDVAKGLELLKTSFQSTTVLTDVFLGAPARPPQTSLEMCSSELESVPVEAV